MESGFEIIAGPSRRAILSRQVGSRQAVGEINPKPRNQIRPVNATRTTDKEKIMSQGVTRTIFRWIHIVFSIPIIGYIYSPFEEIPKYATNVRFVVVPVMLLSGLWMWKGHVVRRLVSRRSARVPMPATRITSA